MSGEAGDGAADRSYELGWGQTDFTARCRRRQLTLPTAASPPPPSATSTAEVHIVHTYRGDLVVSLVAPDGTVYTLLNRSGGSADNVDQTFTVDLSSEAANGTWRLRVQDAASLDTGYINSWTLTL